MAENIARADDDNVTPLHNVQAINDSILSTFAEVYRIDSEIAHLTETHIAPLKETRRDLLQTLKKDCDLDSTNIRLFYKIFARQEHAKTMNDDDASRIADNMRTIFKAMAQGGQLDFVDVLEQSNQ